MHAAMVTVTIDPTYADQADKALREQVIPMVSAAPGFIAGYWLEPADGRAISLVLFETEEQAHQTAPPLGASPTPGATIGAVEFRLVTASA